MLTYFNTKTGKKAALYDSNGQLMGFRKIGKLIYEKLQNRKFKIRIH